MRWVCLAIGVLLVTLGGIAVELQTVKSQRSSIENDSNNKKKNVIKYSYSRVRYTT